MNDEPQGRCRFAWLCAAVVVMVLITVPVASEDFIGIPFNVDSVWEFIPFHRYMFSASRAVSQYSFATQRVTGIVSIAAVVVGPWNANPPNVIRAPPNWVNVTSAGYDCSHVWARTSRLYHYSGELYLRMRHDGTHSGGDAIRTGWWGVPDKIDACVELSVETTMFIVGDTVVAYCSAPDHTCIDGQYPLSYVAPGLPVSPSAIIKHPHLGEISSTGLGAYTVGGDLRPGDNAWLLVFKDDMVWMWAGAVGYSVRLGSSQLMPATGRVVDGYPQRLVQSGRCSGIRYTATPIAEIHDGSVSADGSNDFDYESGVDCRWVIQVPSWMRIGAESEEFTGFNFYFRQFILRPANGSAIDYLELWNSTALNAPVLLFNFTNTTATAPALYHVFSFPPSVERLTFHFRTANYPVQNGSATGWQLTYYLQSRREGSVWSGLYQRFFLTIPNGLQYGANASAETRTRSYVIKPATQTAVRTEFSFELVQLPSDGSGGAAGFLEIFEGEETGNTALQLIANCSGTDPAVILNYCNGKFRGAATVRFHSLLPASTAGVVGVIGRADVLATCQGSQNSSAYSAYLNDGSGAYFHNPSMDCEWLLYPNEPVSEQFAIAFQVSKASLEQCCDLLRFYDGLTSATPVLGTFSGELISMTAPVFSSSPYAMIQFHTDSSFDSEGVEFNYTRLFKPADTPLSSFDGFRSAFTNSDGGLNIEAGRRATMTIRMRDYMDRPILFEWRCIRWYVRLIPHSVFTNATDRQRIAFLDQSIHSYANETYSAVIESTTSSLESSVLDFTAPSLSGVYDAYLVAVMNVQHPDAVRSVQSYDHSPLQIFVGAQMAFGPESLLVASTAATELALASVPLSLAPLNPVSGPFNATAGHPIQMILVIRDRFGNLVTTTSDSELRVFAQSAPIELTRRSNPTSCYNLSIVVETAGTYTLTALVLGIDARGSPAKIVVQPGPIEPSQCDLRGDATSPSVSVSVHQSWRYELQARDKFRNSIIGSATGSDAPHPLAVRPEVVRGSAEDLTIIASPFEPVNGTFQFTVFATSKLEALLYVTVDLIPVRGSPFRFTSGGSVEVIDFVMPSEWYFSFIGVTSAMIVISISWMLVLWSQWTNPLIRAASPVFLIAILFASVLAYMSVPVILAYPPTGLTCRAGSGLIHIAYCAMWSILCLKLWRVQRIVSGLNQIANATPHLTDADRIRYTDGYMIRYVAGVLSVVCLYVTVWFVIDPPSPRLIDGKINDSEDRTVQFWNCQSSGGSAWPTTLFVAEGCMLAWGVFLSVQLRGVSSAYAESKWVAAATYNLVVVAGVLISLIESGATANASTVLLLEAVGITYITAVTIALLFVPKLFAITSGNVGRAPRPPSSDAAQRQRPRGNTPLSHLQPSRRQEDGPGGGGAVVASAPVGPRTVPPTPRPNPPPNSNVRVPGSAGDADRDAAPPIHHSEPDQPHNSGAADLWAIPHLVTPPPSRAVYGDSRDAVIPRDDPKQWGAIAPRAQPVSQPTAVLPPLSVPLPAPLPPIPVPAQDFLVPSQHNSSLAPEPIIAPPHPTPTGSVFDISPGAGGGGGESRAVTAPGSVNASALELAHVHGMPGTSRTPLAAGSGFASVATSPSAGLLRVPAAQSSQPYSPSPPLSPTPFTLAIGNASPLPSSLGTAPSSGIGTGADTSSGHKSNS